jgi:hypothetical protein
MAQWNAIVSLYSEACLSLSIIFFIQLFHIDQADTLITGLCIGGPMGCDGEFILRALLVNLALLLFFLHLAPVLQLIAGLHIGGSMECDGEFIVGALLEGPSRIF